MISKKTAYLIFEAHNEIEKAKELLQRMVDAVKADENKKSKLELDGWFGNKEGLQLSVPSSQSSRSLYNVSSEMALRVIEEHIKNNEQRLIELGIISKIELNDN